MARTPVDFNFTYIRESYFTYRKPKNLTKSDYSKFLKEANTALVRYIIDGGILKLPFGLGSLLIEKSKPTYRVKNIDGKLIPRRYLVDFNETLKLRREIEPTWSKSDWKKVPFEDRPFVIHRNEHTNGYSYKIAWDRRKATFTKLRYFQFKPNFKTFKWALAAKLKSDNKPTYYDKH